MISSLLGAVQFLTIIPVRRATAPPGKSSLFFPLIGAALGITGGFLLEQSRGYIPFTLAALLVLAFWAWISGGLHEDGFADVADAFRAGRPVEKIHAILKDSRIGAHGALALGFSLLIRWQALSAITVDAIPALAAALALPRAALIVLAWLTPPAGTGLGLTFSQSLTTPIALLAAAQGLVFAFGCGFRVAVILLAGTLLIILAARRYFLRRIGGVTGDCLGATAHVVETYCLLVFTCRDCIS